MTDSEIIRKGAADLISHGKYVKAMQAMAEDECDLTVLALLAIAAELARISEDLPLAGKGV